MLKRISILLLVTASIVLSAATRWEEKLENSSFVTVPPGEYTLSRTVVIRHNLTILLENGATLKSTCDPMFLVKGGELRINGVGRSGKIISLSKGTRGWRTEKRGAAFNLNQADGKLPLRLFMRNIHLKAYNGVDGFQLKDGKNDIAELNIAECLFECEEKAIATHSLKLGTAKIENCTFIGGDNPIFLNSAACGGMIVRSNTLRNFGRTGILLGKAGQIAEGCTTHLPDTIVHDNRLIGGGRGATIDDSYIQGILNL